MTHVATQSDVERYIQEWSPGAYVPITSMAERINKLVEALEHIGERMVCIDDEAMEVAQQALADYRGTKE